jgi:hypothetical protein
MEYSAWREDHREHEGGDLELHGLVPDREGFRRKDMMLVLPSTGCTAVTPTTKGTRQVIVG